MCLCTVCHRIYTAGEWTAECLINGLPVTQASRPPCPYRNCNGLIENTCHVPRFVPSIDTSVARADLIRSLALKTNRTIADLLVMFDDNASLENAEDSFKDKYELEVARVNRLRNDFRFALSNGNTLEISMWSVNDCQKNITIGSWATPGSDILREYNKRLNEPETLQASVGKMALGVGAITLGYNSLKDSYGSLGFFDSQFINTGMMNQEDCNILHDAVNTIINDDDSFFNCLSADEFQMKLLQIFKKVWDQHSFAEADKSNEDRFNRVKPWKRTKNDMINLTMKFMINNIWVFKPFLITIAGNENCVAFRNAIKNSHNVRYIDITKEMESAINSFNPNSTECSFGTNSGQNVWLIMYERDGTTHCKVAVTYCHMTANTYAVSTNQNIFTALNYYSVWTSTAPSVLALLFNKPYPHEVLLRYYGGSGSSARDNGKSTTTN
jgi:hypothetical protein